MYWHIVCSWLRMRLRSSLLLHPIFLSALAVLLVNDHALKHSLVHGVVTGKLSDFAGLLVAPIVVAELAQALSRSARTQRIDHIACLVVGAFFTALKLFPAFAAGYDQVIERITGLACRTAVDPTDLVALLILPLAFVLLQKSQNTTQDGTSHHKANVSGNIDARAALSHGALFVALFACMATSPGPSERQVHARMFLVNETATTMDVRIRWYNGRFDCARATRDFANLAHAFQNRTLFGPGLTFRLRRRELAALDQESAWRQANTPQPSNTTHDTFCDVAMIAADGLPETLVLIDNTLAVTTRVASGTTSTAGTTVSLVEDPTLRFTPRDVLAARFDPTTRSQCPAPIAPALRTSDPALVGNNSVALTQKERSDSCFDLELQRGVASTPFFVCVPESMFPFVVGDTLTFRVSNTALQISNATHELTLDFVRRATLSDISLGLLTIRTTENANPCGTESACGAFDVPASTTLIYDGRTLPREADGTAVFGNNQRIAVGGAFTRVAAPSSCDGSLGAQFTYARLRAL